MGTLVLLVVTTALGAAIGHFAFAMVGVGAVVGFIAGVCIRCGGAPDFD